MDTVYHTPRTRPATWTPRRVWYVLRYLKRTLTPGTPKAISNKHIQEAVGFGSEGEVSQIMRWLAGDAPTTGRWAYGVLQATEQRYRFVTRERMPSGGYSLTLLAAPAPIAPAAIEPQIAQLDMFADDPSMIPPCPRQDAADRGSFSAMAPERTDLAQPNAPNARSQRDHVKESLHDQQQQQPSLARESNPLYQRLMADSDMSETLAMRVVRHAPGTLADFLADLAAAPRHVRAPLYWLAAIWATGKRPTPRTTAPRHVPGQTTRPEPTDNRPVPQYVVRQERPDALSREQIRAKLAAMPRPDWIVKAGQQ